MQVLDVVVTKMSGLHRGSRSSISTILHDDGHENVLRDRWMNDHDDHGRFCSKQRRIPDGIHGGEGQRCLDESCDHQVLGLDGGLSWLVRELCQWW